jgi:hypothetical protein
MACKRLTMLHGFGVHIQRIDFGTGLEIHIQLTVQEAVKSFIKEIRGLYIENTFHLVVKG